MLNKLFTNSAITAYGPTFPTGNVTDGTIFYKTEAGGGFNPGFYIYRIIADSNSVSFGPQPSQGWASADVAGMYVKKTGDTMTGTLELVDYLKISNGSTDQRIVMGNTSATLPTLINSKNKEILFGLGTSFAGNGGTMDTWLKLDFKDATNGIKWKNQKVWHQGNDGVGSGLDADLLDGMNSSYTSVANTIPARNASQEIFVSRVNLNSPDSENPAIKQFIVTSTGDGFTRKANMSHTTESIRLHIDTVTPRRMWNINISGSAATALAVDWTKVSGKPSWLEDGQVSWDDIKYKPKLFYRFTDNANSPKPAEFSKGWYKNTSNVMTEVAGIADSVSGFYAVGSSDFPRNNNTLTDPLGDGAWGNLPGSDDYWIGMQVVARGGRDTNPPTVRTDGTGLPNVFTALPAAQLAFRWDAENGVVAGDNLGQVSMAFRINDDDDGADPTSFSQWYKVWTNASLRKVSQLENDAEYVSSASITTDYLSKTSTANQNVVSWVEFKKGLRIVSPTSPGNQINLLENGNIELVGIGKITTASGHFESTSGHHYSKTGRIWSDGGKVGAGDTLPGHGAAFLLSGYTDTGTVQTGSLRLTNSNVEATFFRIYGNLTAPDVMYEINPDNAYTTPNASHRFNKTIKTTGDVVAYASDERLKLNITPIANAVEKVKIISGVTFDWDMGKCESIKFQPANEHEHGLIAQRVQEVMPDAVTVCPASDEYLTVRYERIVSLLTAAVTEQQVMIDDLKREVTELKNKFN